MPGKEKETMAGGQIKKAYEKPVLRTIELATDEVLAVGCKTAITFAVGGGAPGCTLIPCVVNGS